MQNELQFNHTPFYPLYDLSTIEKNNMRFYQTPSGKFLPSVTTVVNFGDKPWLEEWKQNLGAEKAEKETKRCGDRGTAVHDMCEKYVKNLELSEVTKNHQASDIEMFNQLRMILRNRVNNIKLQETALWSEILGLAGRVDLIAEYQGTLSIIDFKTANNYKDHNKIQNYFLQCTAYALMAKEVYNVDIENMVIMIAVERGTSPQIVKKPILPYVKPLLEQIDLFNINNTIKP